MFWDSFVFIGVAIRDSPLLNQFRPVLKGPTEWAGLLNKILGRTRYKTKSKATNSPIFVDNLHIKVDLKVIISCRYHLAYRSLEDILCKKGTLRNIFRERGARPSGSVGP